MENGFQIMIEKESISVLIKGNRLIPVSFLLLIIYTTDEVDINSNEFIGFLKSIKPSAFNTLIELEQIKNEFSGHEYFHKILNKS